jgi:hypothetical protein
MKDRDTMRAEVIHLRTLAFQTTDERALKEIQFLIDELERRIKSAGNGQGET